TSTFSGVSTWLSAAAALGLVGPTTGGLLWYEVTKRTLAAAGVVLVGVFSSGKWPWRRRAALIALSAGTVFLAIAPIGPPSPTIDVFAWTQTSVHALLDRIDPYTVIAPDVYRGRHDPGYTVSVYPYMPATLIIYAPFVRFFGDFRFALSASVALTIGLVCAI